MTAAGLWRQRGTGVPLPGDLLPAEAAAAVEAELAGYRRQSGGADVWPAARLAAPGLADALATKRFVVTGSAVFNPSRPFHPAPTAADYDPDREYVADERFSFTFPAR